MAKISCLRLEYKNGLSFINNFNKICKIKIISFKNSSIFPCANYEHGFLIARLVADIFYIFSGECRAVGVRLNMVS